LGISARGLQRLVRSLFPNRWGFPNAHKRLASVTLLHPEQIIKILTLKAMTKCSLFQNNPTLSIVPYRVQSPVSFSIVRQLIRALKGNANSVTDTNDTKSQQLCVEFGFSELAAKLSDFLAWMDLKKPEREAKPQTGPAPAAETEAEAETEIEVETGAEVETETEAEVEREVETKAGTEAEVETEAETEVEAEI
jgi:hypothetical protein